MGKLSCGYYSSLHSSGVYQYGSIQRFVDRAVKAKSSIIYTFQVGYASGHQCGPWKDGVHVQVVRRLKDLSKVGRTDVPRGLSHSYGVLQTFSSC